MSTAANLARAGRQSAVYGLGSIAGNLLGIVMLRFYTSQLPEAQFGDVDYATRLILLLAIPARLGLIAAVLRFNFDSDDPAQRRRTFATAFWTLQATTLAVGLAIVALAPEFGDDIFTSSGQGTQIFAVMGLGIYTTVNWDVVTVLYRAQGRPAAYVARTLANLLANVGLTLFFMLVLDLGPLGSLLGTYVGQLAVYLVIVGEQRTWILGGFDRPLLRRMLHFGLPLVPSAAALWFVNVVNRPIVRGFDGDAAQGLLAFASRIGTGVLLVVTAFQLAWPMVAYEIKDDGEARRTYAAVMRVYLAAMGWLAVCVALAAPLLVRIFAAQEAFLAATPAVVPIAIGAPLFGAFQIAVVIVGRVKKNRSTWIVTAVAAVVEIAALLVLVPAFGFVGGAWGTVVGYGTMFVLMLVWAQRLFPVPYDWNRIARVIGILAVAVVAAVELPESGLAAWIGRIAFAVAVPVAFVVGGGASRAELRAAAHIARSFRARFRPAAAGPVDVPPS